MRQTVQEKFVQSSRPRIDVDLAIIERHSRSLTIEPDDAFQPCDGVTLGQLASWNAVGGVRDRARRHGILTADQDRTLYRALVTYSRQPLVVREATRRVIRLLEGCQRRIRMRGSVCHPNEVRKETALPRLGWGHFAGV